MKVACIGNANNNFFSMVRYLRDKGVDAELVLMNNELAQFHPSNDTFDLSYQQYTRQVNWGHTHKLHQTNMEHVRQDMKGYDYIIACGAAPAYLRAAGLKANLFMPYGADLYAYTAYRITSPKFIRSYNALVKQQRMAIAEVDHIGVGHSNETFQEVFDRLKIADKVIKVSIPMVYNGLYSPENLKAHQNQSHWHAEFKSLRSENDMLIFHFNRLFWKNASDIFSDKGNDRFLKAFARFAKGRTDGYKAHVMICEYGPQVAETKQLVKELEIEEYITWFPLMPRKEIMLGVMEADICIGQFVVSWLLYGSVFEICLMGTPFMGYREDENYAKFYDALYPLINVSTVDQIHGALEEYKEDPDKFQEMGDEAREWFTKNLVDDQLDKILALIKAG